MNRLAVDGVRCRSAQALVLKRTLTEVENHKDAAKMQVPGSELLAVTLLKAFDIDVGDVIYQVDLPGAESRQADRVLFLGFADDRVEIRQVMAGTIGLPVVLKTHHPGLLPARPGHQLEWPRANGMFRGRVKNFGGLQAGGIMQQVGWHRGVWLVQVKPHGVLIQDVNRCDAVECPMVELSADGG